MGVFTIAGGEPFAETLARGLLERLGADPFALADATILLPTRRAVRTLGETFARLLGGAALLPQLRPLGDVDEDAFAFDAAAEDLALAPAIAPIRRRLLLATLVGRWDRAKHGGAGQLTFAQSALLARALGHFLDEAETQGADLSRLESLAPDALAAHWAEVRDFLILLREEWPKLLAAEDAIEPVARRNRLLAALAEHYRRTPPAGPVIAAGTTGSIPATAGLLAAVAALPNGALVLPGLDRELDEESWAALDPGHPQFGMKELLARLGVARADVGDWRADAKGARAVLLRETLRPAPTTDAWRAIAERKDIPPSPVPAVAETRTSPASGGGKETERASIFPPPLAEEVPAKRAEGGTDFKAIAEDLKDISLVEAPHPGAEALIIALVLREALETSAHTAALVTPDRNLARRVAAELGRWNIAIDDSAGRPLAHTAPGAFLLQALEAVSQEFAPVPLLALLKHPLAAAGMDPAEFRRMARILDRECLRGPRPDAGLDGIRRAIARSDDAASLSPWLERIADCFAPLCAAFACESADLPDIAQAHAQACEALAASDSQSGAARLWQGDAGTGAAELFASLQDEAQGLPAIEPASYASLIRTLIEERPVRPAYGLHPRLAILGPLEARLQRFDVVVLGGLNEGTWPAAVAADPWLSRPMRENLGFASPERAIGLAAHDFAMLAAGPRVVLTRALKSEGAPTVASRWLQRLIQLTSGLKLTLDDGADYKAMASLLELPARFAPERRPEPRPPVAARPRNLSVTEIETWLRDPYAIYAKHVLKLAPLEALDADVGPLERGTTIHRILELFLHDWDANAGRAEERLVAIADEIFAQNGISHATLALWRPRFAKAARWFVGLERTRRSEISRSHLESKGTHSFAAPAGPFILRCRADRIDALKAGGGAIIDYKTGNPPSLKQVKQLLAPQLPLEAAILAEGGFSDIGPLAPRELIYIQFSGGAVPGKLIDIPDAGALAREAAEKLAGRIALFDREETAYLPRLIPFRKDIDGDYDHLARVREWSVTGWQEDGE